MEWFLSWRCFPKAWGLKVCSQLLLCPCNTYHLLGNVIIIKVRLLVREVAIHTLLTEHRGELGRPHLYHRIKKAPGRKMGRPSDQCCDFSGVVHRCVQSHLVAWFRVMRMSLSLFIWQIWKWHGRWTCQIRSGHAEATRPRLFSPSSLCILRSSRWP